MNSIAIIGLGYVGLPLALQFARSGCRVLGLDIDPAKTDALNAGRSYIAHVPAEAVAAQRAAGLLEAATDFSRVAECDSILLCVPTPLSAHRDPDLSCVLENGRAIAPHLASGTLVVLESTTYPGTIDTDLRQVLELGSGMTAGIDFHLAFSPEREDPGNPDSKVATIPKVVGDLSPACLEKALALYRHAITALGLAYKANVDDDRESPTYKLIEKLEARGATVNYHDPHLPVIPRTREHAQYSGRVSVSEISPDYDLILLSTAHDGYREHDFSSDAIPLVDTRNAVRPARRPAKYSKA